MGDLSATEAAGIQNLVATLSTASERVVSVTYATSDNTASAGDDYTAGTGTITFNVGDTTKNVPVAVLEDAIDEDDEIVTVTLSNPSNVTLNDHIGELTISDDDVEPTLSISDVVTPNENAVVNSATVTLSAASEKTVSVNYATSDGTATAANDYISASGTLEFAPGVTTQTIPVTMVQDSLDEINETVTITLSSASNAGIADATGIITITDDDGTPTLSISPVNNC